MTIAAGGWQRPGRSTGPEHLGYHRVFFDLAPVFAPAPEPAGG